jgi:hypothetical protein
MNDPADKSSEMRWAEGCMQIAKRIKAEFAPLPEGKLPEDDGTVTLVKVWTGPDRYLEVIAQD